VTREQLAHAILERLAAELTPRQFDAYLLREVSGYTFQRIADELGCTRQTAHDHWARARDHVARLLHDGEWPQ
jgi:DNA-directed RNA polymerase specialized sigma24 family protein